MHRVGFLVPRPSAEGACEKPVGARGPVGPRSHAPERRRMRFARGVENLFGHAGATSALLGHAQMIGHVAERIAAFVHADSDVLIGNRVAQADDHGVEKCRCRHE